MKKKLAISIAAVALVLAAVPALAFANVAADVAPFPAAPSQKVVQATLDTATQAQDAVAAQQNSAAEARVAAPVVDPAPAPAPTPVACGGFVDADSDGICDNYGSGVCGGHMNGAGFVDADGNGVCDNFGTGNGGQGCGVVSGGYIDADGNGVCDNYGTGNGGYGRGAGNGAGYVDSNNDGTCDNYGTGNNGNGGYGRGHGGGQHGRMR